jgi:hypothetical protein
LCYAKITPAALHCDNFSWPGREGSEAVGCLPKFGLTDSVRITAGLASPIAMT